MDMWVEVASCGSRLCAWSGAAHQTVPDPEHGTCCPKCGAKAATWRVNQGLEMARLREERAAIQAAWQAQYARQEATLAAARVASEPAKMRCRATAAVQQKTGGGPYAEEARRDLDAIIQRQMAKDHEA